jgi:multicomponent K+:H+ antiporter subunit E
MKPRFPLLWIALVAMWLALAGTLTAGEAILGALAAWISLRVFAKLQPPVTIVRRPWKAVSLLAVVVLDIVRSNVAVAKIVLLPERKDRHAGFVDIPLDVRHPAALATLACIITSTPGTAWAGYDSQASVLTLHVLDIGDAAALVESIKVRYERPLMEIFR